ncbi:threonine-phosphate decarboxylase CobD [Oxynema aestuarii]|uniref:threonine-phosphate decarboxylase n=1 Tax=Oxynema aestuarii AP17 TaxID=2064643 RepID=A0A6H1TX62_9CYAN|nr:threonine-phosphate decarboxylase CobD [Oxynema aestuarii]QIZ70530.1 threonine-phosphate decarboxylase [Oxynema aestuarii AP17]RMH72572.1 MAG: threonine-phosphate decarboxylase [Cyanobacteria bacterium J007]
MKRPAHGGNLAWAAALAGCPPSSILDFSASINPLGPPASAIAAIQSQLSTIAAYPNPDYRELRSAIGAFHDLDPDWILPGNGAAELLTWAARDLSALAATVLLTPAFGDYGRSLDAVGAQVVTVPLSVVDEQWTIAPTLTEHPAIAPQNMGLLLNNPHNPTGRLFSQTDLLPYLDSFALVVVDEAFMDFLTPERQQSAIELIQTHPNLAIVRSLTKFYSLPGLRLGYCIAHPDRLQRWQQWRDPWPVNSLAAASARAVLGDRPFQAQTFTWLAKARENLFDGLTAIPTLHPYPSAANFLLVRCDRSACEVQEQLLKHDRILIRDCLSFPELGDRYFRIAVRSESDNQKLLRGLTKIME